MMILMANEFFGIKIKYWRQIFYFLDLEKMSDVELTFTIK